MLHTYVFNISYIKWMIVVDECRMKNKWEKRENDCRVTKGFVSMITRMRENWQCRDD